MEYPLITNVAQFVVGSDYFFKPKKTSEGKPNKFQGVGVPVGNEKLFKIGKLSKIEANVDSITKLTFTDVGDSERKKILKKPVTLNFSSYAYTAKDQTDDFYSLFPAGSLGALAAAPVLPGSLKKVLGEVTIGENVGAWTAPISGAEAAAGAAVAAVAAAGAGGAGAGSANVSAAVAAIAPMSAATMDLFLWCMNGDFGTNSLKSILKRNPDLNHQIIGTMKPMNTTYSFMPIFSASTRRPQCNLRFDSLKPRITDALTGGVSVGVPDFLPPDMRPQAAFTISTIISPLALLIICYEKPHLRGLDRFMGAMASMLEKGANPSLGLNAACWIGLPDVVDVLVKAGASANEPQRFVSATMEVVTIPLLTAVPYLGPPSVRIATILIGLSSDDESDNREMLITDSIISQLEARKAPTANPDNANIDRIIAIAEEKRKVQEGRLFVPGSVYYRALQRKIHPGMTNAELNELNRLADLKVYGNNNALGGGSYKSKRRQRRGTIKKQKTVTE